MKNIVQRPPAAERNCAMLDGLAWQILDKGPKTPIGLALAAQAERWLCRYLWMRDIEPLAFRSGCAPRDRQCDASRRHRRRPRQPRERALNIFRKQRL